MNNNRNVRWIDLNPGALLELKSCHSDWRYRQRKQTNLADKDFVYLSGKDLILFLERDPVENPAPGLRKLGFYTFLVAGRKVYLHVDHDSTISSSVFKIKAL